MLQHAQLHISGCKNGLIWSSSIFTWTRTCSNSILSLSLTLSISLSLSTLFSQLTIKIYPNVLQHAPLHINELQNFENGFILLSCLRSIFTWTRTCSYSILSLSLYLSLSLNSPFSIKLNSWKIYCNELNGENEA